MERIEELIAGKRRIFEYYKRYLDDLPVAMNTESKGTVNGYWMPTIVMDEGIPFDRAKLLAAFGADNIDGRMFFWPLSMLPMFKPTIENTVSYSLYHRAVNLPTYHDMDQPAVERVCRVVRQIVE
jgi:perosamine synthetase